MGSDDAKVSDCFPYYGARVLDVALDLGVSVCPVYPDGIQLCSAWYLDYADSYGGGGSGRSRGQRASRGSICSWGLRADRR